MGIIFRAELFLCLGSWALRPDQVGPLGGPFGLTVISKTCFQKFRAWTPPSPLTEPGRTRKLISYLTEIDLLNGWQLISNIFPEASYHLIGTVTAWYHMEGNVEIYWVSYRSPWGSQERDTNFTANQGSVSDFTAEEKDLCWREQKICILFENVLFEMPSGLEKYIFMI